MTQRAGFTISYDGSALKANEMDVRDLAPALLSLGEMFDAANRILNGERAEIKLQVKATSPGSFELLFELVQSLGSQITMIFSGDEITAALNLRDLIFSPKEGICWLLKKLKGKTPDKLTDLKNGMIRIEFDGEAFDVPLKLLRLYQDIAIRKATEKVFSPLEKEGIDSLEVRDKEKVLIRIEKADLRYFKVPDIADEVILENVIESAYSIISLAFKEDNKWRLHDGNNTIHAVIKDDSFLRRVEENLISFSKGDLLICQVRIIQKRTDSGLKTEYEVERVLEHKLAARQLPLTIDQSRFEDDDD